MSKISKTLPTKDSVHKKSAKIEMISLASKIFRFDNIIKVSEIVGAKEEHSLRNFKVFILKDGSKWVPGDKGAERVIGAYYLDAQLKNLTGLNFQWSAVQTKYLIKSYTDKVVFKCQKGFNTCTVHSDSVISLSKHVGNKKPDIGSEIEQDKTKISLKTGFTDFLANTNLREQEDGSITIIDTEYSSFKSSSPSLLPSYMAGQTYSFLWNEIFSFSVLLDVLDHNASIIGCVEEYLSDDPEWA